jgi:cell division protein ZapE
VTLPVTQGRTLAVPQAARGVARFSFAELCARPLGAADYLAIAARFHTLILSDIPRMGPEKRNEAKRFVTLIDTLYDNRVKLVCSAAAWPGELYPAGDGSFEFERTVSRLIEMQSHDYFAAAKTSADLDRTV